MEQHQSSNSGHADEYFQKLGLKKVSFDGQISDSGEDSHSSESNYKGSKIKRNNYSKQICNLLQQENQNGVDDQKTKLIKKNCVSAKMSRQRKKIYIELLQKKVQKLKQNIINTRQKLKVNRSKIMHYIQDSNKQKRVYIEQKMKDSKRLIAMSEQFSALSNSGKALQLQRKSELQNIITIPADTAHNYLQSIPQNLQPTQIPPQMYLPSNPYPPSIISPLIISQSIISPSIISPQHSIPNKKSKRTLKNAAQPDPTLLIKQIQEKKQLLQLGINSYLYKFGINGILKNDVVQLLKEKWYQLVIDQTILDAGKTTQLEKAICDFRDCFWQIDQSNKKLDYLLRQLRDKIKPQYVVKFILQKQFFKSFSSTPSTQLHPQMSQQKIEAQQQVKQQKQEQQYQPCVKNPSKNRIFINEESFLYQSESVKKQQIQQYFLGTSSKKQYQQQ